MKTGFLETEKNGGRAEMEKNEMAGMSVGGGVAREEGGEGSVSEIISDLAETMMGENVAGENGVEGDVESVEDRLGFLEDYV